MYFFLAIVAVLLVVDNYTFNKMKLYINRAYRDTLKTLNKTNPFYKIEKKHSRNSFLMRSLILAVFWLLIDFILINTTELLEMDIEDQTILSILKFISTNKFYIFPIIGFFVYFGINIYSKNNTYLRTIDIITSIIPSLFLTFIS